MSVTLVIVAFSLPELTLWAGGYHTSVVSNKSADVSIKFHNNSTHHRDLPLLKISLVFFLRNKGSYILAWRWSSEPCSQLDPPLHCPCKRPPCWSCCCPCSHDSLFQTRPPSAWTCGGSSGLQGGTSWPCWTWRGSLGHRPRSPHDGCAEHSGLLTIPDIIFQHPFWQGNISYQSSIHTSYS